MPSRSSQFRIFAQKSRDAAGRSCPAEARELLLEIANHWDALASLVERAEAVLREQGQGRPDRPK